jgi:hypothetical protein
MLIDVAISGNRNVIKKEAEKILKCKDLTIEIQRMWKVKTKVIPVIIGATGRSLKSFTKYVSNIPGNHEFMELQKNNHTGHCTHILESANAETQRNHFSPATEQQERIKLVSEVYRHGINIGKEGSCT